MKKSRKLEHPSWSYDVRSGWSEVEDIVLAASADRTKMDEALSETGFSSKLLALESDSQIRCTIYSNCMGRCPEYYVEMLFPGNSESFYIANLPSLLAVLRDIAPIMQGKCCATGANDGPIEMAPTDTLDRIWSNPDAVEAAQKLSLILSKAEEDQKVRKG